MFESNLETKHTKKTEAELAKRMMTEWKQFCSSFFDNNREKFEEFLRNMDFNFESPMPVYYHTDKPLGIVMDRRFKMYESSVARLVVIGTPDDFEVISAYPEHHTSKLSYIGRYDFSNFDYEESGEKTVELFHLIRNNFYKCQIVKDTVKVFMPKTVVRINTVKENITIETGKDEITGKHKTISYTYRDFESVLTILELIDGYQPTYRKSIFE